MSEKTPTDLPASIRGRLLNLAGSRGEELQNVLVRYGVERLLYRLGRSAARDRLVLKGAMLFYLWEGELHRPTRDVDFLAYGDPSPDVMTTTLRAVCATEVEDDGVVFLASTSRVEPIRDANAYGGLRVSLVAMLGNARIPLRVDLGFGDAVTPSAELAMFPTLLESPAPEIRVYPPETVIAEKYEAMVTLGIANTRMKDFYDVFTLLTAHAFDGGTVAMAIANTFARRGTPLPAVRPTALTGAFSANPEKARQWRAFLTRSKLTEVSAELPEIVAEIASFIWPVSEGARSGRARTAAWLPGVGWTAD